MSAKEAAASDHTARSDESSTPLPSRVWYLNVPIRTLSPGWLHISDRPSWEWVRHVSVRRRSIQHVGFWRRCQTTAWSLSWIFLMSLTAFTDQICLSRLPTGSLSCFLTATLLTQIRQYSIMVSNVTKGPPSKGIPSVLYFFVMPSTRCLNHLIPFSG